MSGYGLLMYHKKDLDNTPVLVKDPASETKLFKLTAANDNTADAWIQIFNAGSAPTLGSDVPDYVLFVPKGDGTNHGASSLNIPGDEGIDFEDGCYIAATTTVDGSTKPTNDIKVSALYL